MTRARIAIAATDDTGGAFQSVRAKLDTLGTQAATVASRFSAVSAGLLGLLGTAAAFGAFIQGATESVTRLKDLQDATGSTIGRLSGLTNLAAKAGLGFETVSGALVKFNQALLTAKPNSPVALAIERLGLSVRELREQDPVEALQTVARALANFADDGNKARVAQQLFGESIGRVAPLLKELAQDGELAASVTDNQAEAFDRLSKSVSRLSANWTILQQRLAGPVVESLARDVDRLKIAGDVFGGTGTAVRTLLLEFKRFDNAAEGVQFYARAIQRLAKERDRLANAPNPFAAQREGPAIDARIAQLRQLEEFYRRVAKAELPDLGQTDARELARRGRLAAKLPSIGEQGEQNTQVIARQTSALDGYVQSLREQLLATQSVSAEERARIDINRGLLGVLDEAARAQVLSLAQALDAVKAQQAAAAERRALEQEGLSLTRSLQTEQERLAEQLARADLLLEQGALSWVTYGRLATQSLGKITAEVAAIQLPKLEKLSEPIQKVSEFAAQAARNIQDALGESVLRVVQGNASSVLDVWKDMLQRMVAQALSAQLGNALFGADFGKTGQIGGLFGQLGTAIFGGARADGGPVYPGRAYLVGERGPEIVMPRAAGTVVPNSALGGPQFTYAPTIHVNGDVSPQTIAAMRSLIASDRARWMRQLSIQGGA